MAFWGMLVNPGKSYTLRHDGGPKRLRISQATLEGRCEYWTNRRSVVQCSVGTKPPVNICSLSIKGVDSCQLDLEFEEPEDIVFSVSGPRGVHLAGYYYANSNSSTAIVTTNGSYDVRKTTSLGAEDVEEAMNKLPSQKSKENEHKSTEFFINDSTLNFLPNSHEPPRIEGVVELTDGKNMGSADFYGHMVGNNEFAEQESLTRERKNGSQEEEMIVDKSERSDVGTIRKINQKSPTAMPNTFVPPRDACILKEKKSKEKLTIHDCVWINNQDKAEDYTDSGTLKDQGISRMSCHSSGLQIFEKPKEKKKKKKMEVVADKDKESPAIAYNNCAKYSAHGYHSYANKNFGAKELLENITDDDRQVNNWSALQEKRKLKTTVEDIMTEEKVAASMCETSNTKSVQRPPSIPVHHGQDEVVPSMVLETQQRKKVKKKKKGKGQKDLQIKDEVVADINKKNHAEDANDSQCHIRAESSHDRRVHDFAVLQGMERLKTSKVEQSMNQQSAIEDNGEMYNATGNQRSCTTHHQVHIVSVPSSMFETRHCKELKQKKKRKKKDKGLKCSTTEKSAIITKDNQPKTVDGGQEGISDKIECAR